MRLFIALVVVCSVPAAAAAFEVKYTEDGAPIRWNEATVPFVVDATLDNVPPSVVKAAVTAGFSAWSAVSSSYLQLTYDGPGEGQLEGHQQSGENVHLVRFERDYFEYDQAALAVTLLTYEVRTGTLVDADIVVNAVDYTFAVDSQAVDAHDIQNTIAHEAGHFVGLAHEQHDETATMYPVALPGEIAKRSLGEDDEAGISFLYPGESDSLSEMPADSAGPIEPAAPAVDDDSVTLDRVEIGLDCRQGPAPGGSVVLLLFPILIGLLCRRGAQPRSSGGGSRPRRNAALLTGVLLTLAVPMTSKATTMVALELDDLYAASSVAFRGQVEQTESYWVDGRILTDSTLVVQECLVGACGEVELVRQIGGQVGTLAQEVVGTRLLAAGDEVVLFARIAQDGVALEPVGMSQGIFHLDRDVLTRDLADVHLVADGKPVESLASIPRTLGELREAVRLLNSR